MSPSDAVHVIPGQRSGTEPSAPQVTKIEVSNFRLLRDATLSFSKNVTVCVGRNNTGKTSLAEILTKFVRNGDFSLKIQDFSSDSYMHFLDAYRLLIKGKKEEAREKVPVVSLTIHIEYDKNSAEYGALSPFIVDLDPDCCEAVIRFQYELKGGQTERLFKDIPKEVAGDPDDLNAVLEKVGPLIPRLFERTVMAIDPNDPTNTCPVTVGEVRQFMRVDFLKAQRGLDDEKEKTREPIGKILENLYTATVEAKDYPDLQKIALEASETLEKMSAQLNEGLGRVHDRVAPDIAKFGYPGLGNQQFVTSSNLDPSRLLSNFTRIHYPGVAGVQLPEHYSGLGSRNLLLILLTLFSYYRKHTTSTAGPSVHLVFLEEPEAHLHPQMQEVFIQQLKEFGKKFPEFDESARPWSPQFLVTTHSAHIANRAPFSDIRYFRKAEGGTGVEGVAKSEILNLSDAPVNESFLHKYLTLTRSDLFFADKAILVEGASERIFLPAAIEEFEKEKKKSDEGGVMLSNQYVTLLEVGGAYAYLFYPLLNFLGLQALIITDIDSVRKNENGKHVNCRVSQGEGTSNPSINDWFKKRVTVQDVLREAETQPLVDGRICLAYQVPERPLTACGRTFEDAFVLANPNLFNLPAEAAGVLERELAAEDEVNGRKVDFALKYAVEDRDWEIPRYIRRGLEWLLGESGEKNLEKVAIK